jgi:hypothetical protein
MSVYPLDDGNSEVLRYARESTRAAAPNRARHLLYVSDFHLQSIFRRFERAWNVRFQVYRFIT